MADTIRRLHHAQITIPGGSEEAGRQFYCGVLLLPEIAKPAALAGRGGFWLRVGDAEIHVAPEDGSDRANSRAHLAYEVGDVTAWRVRLTDAGCVILDALPLPGYDRFEFRDPFGNRVEIIQRTDER